MKVYTNFSRCKRIVIYSPHKSHINLRRNEQIKSKYGRPPSKAAT